MVSMVATITAEGASKFRQTATLVLLLTKIAAVGLVIAYYEQLKMYTPWTMLATKAGCSAAVYVLASLVKSA